MIRSEDDFRALIEQAHQIEELTKHPGWDVFVDFLNFGPGGMAFRQGQLVKGGPRTIEDYREQTGFVAGLSFALDGPARVAQMVETEREQRAEHFDDAA